MISKLEMKRQMFHILTGLFFLAILYFNIFNEYFIFLILCLGLGLSLVSRGKNIPIIDKFLKNFDRPKDFKEMPGKGAIYMIIGILTTILIFEKRIALASIMILTLGDSIGPMVGHFGRFKHPFSNVRYFEGLLAGIIAGTLGAMLFVVWWKALIASTIAMIAESIDEVKGEPIDDNVIMPIIAGVVLLLLGLI